ncbi:MAG: hypothetical protein ACRENE_34385, partial [Polyangiaceae bacterium]
MTGTALAVAIGLGLLGAVRPRNAGSAGNAGSDGPSSAGGAIASSARSSHAALESQSQSQSQEPEPTGTSAPADPQRDDSRPHEFRLPSGRAPALGCAAARAIVAQARSQLSHPPEPVDARALADSAADWLDPYGLWSVAPDSPLVGVFDKRAASLVADLEGK